MIMRNLIILLLCLFCTGQIFAATCGDVNDNGMIDIVDALLIAQYYVGLNPPNFDPSAADVDGNNRIDIVDALIVAQYYVGLIPSLPGCEEPTPGPDSMPIYELGIPEVNEEMISRLAGDLFGISGEVFIEENSLTTCYVIREGSKVVEVDIRTGAIWAADEDQLWNPEMKPDIPDDAAAVQIADSIINNNSLLPDINGQPVSIQQGVVGRTMALKEDTRNNTKELTQLDVQVNYSIMVEAETDNGIRSLPVVGGGGEYCLTLGNDAHVIAFSGVWRPVLNTTLYSPKIPRDKADELFEQMTGEMNVISYESSLAYYAAPTPSFQQYLYPVYVYKGEIRNDQSVMAMRLVMIPATEFGPEIIWPEPVPQRTEQYPEFDENDEGDEIVTDPSYAGNTRAPSSWKEAGASWIGMSGGLAGSQANAQGFLDELSSDGWTINFDWGDQCAWESDWNENDDWWVDEADFVFYTGHASPDEWQLAPPDDNELHHTEAGTWPADPGDHWGQEDLEWFIIAACGPLQDDKIVTGGGDVFDRWRGSFDGLHLFMGYAAATYDNTVEGEKIVSYAKSGHTLAYSWFRTAKEVQPSTNSYGPPYGPTIWVGVLFGWDPSVSSILFAPYFDHPWGHGWVSPDMPAPPIRICIWTTT